jgi:hypothetical protein
LLYLIDVLKHILGPIRPSLAVSEGKGIKRHLLFGEIYKYTAKK